MRRKIAAVLTVVMLCGLLVYGKTDEAFAESLYVRKIVSVVYDDSGSMRGDKWAYANYAMQTFCGMLNSDDQLFITYMSSWEADETGYTPEQIDLSAAGIQGSVDSIKGRSKAGSTPYEAVELAYKKLKSVPDSNPNTQYWLVIITDGVFNSFNNQSYDDAQRYLDEQFSDYTKETMPNGTNAQVTFLAIGVAVDPHEKTDKGIYTYYAASAPEIVNAMNGLADRISGRTRLNPGLIDSDGGNTIRVSSPIPLLNIVTFVQGTGAKVAEVKSDEGVSIPITRRTAIDYPGYDDLAGGAFLLGDSKQVIGSGTYDIRFDQNVDPSKVVVLFEPALETRMTITLNGKEITGYSDLDAARTGDTVSVTAKIYEVGTDKEIDPSLLPEGTTFSAEISEDGTLSEQSSSSDMSIQDFPLSDAKTEIKTTVTIPGFTPIVRSVSFTPLNVPRVVYTMSSSFGSDVKSVRYDDLSSNKDLTICFTVYADGVAITDPEAVKALKPTISTSPTGNNGTVSYSDDGKIVFTPIAAGPQEVKTGSYPVEVKCVLQDGASASETYTVLLSTYQVIGTDADQSVKKTEWYNNSTSVSFYITKDGARLGKTDVENSIDVILSEEYKQLKTNIVVSDDGTITVTPYSEEKHDLTFWSWWGNWAYYFGLSGTDNVVTLSHPFGTGTAKIPVVQESLQYQLLNVYLPLLIEAAALITFITWLVFVIKKPRYAKNAALYVGRIMYNNGTGTHIIRSFNPISLSEFNKIKKGNGRLKFKRTADVVSAGGVRIRADKGERIICEMPFPWFRGRITPVDFNAPKMNTPKDVSDYIRQHRTLEIREFAPTETVEGDYARALSMVTQRNPGYLVLPDAPLTIVDERKVIAKGYIVIYTSTT